MGFWRKFRRRFQHVGKTAQIAAIGLDPTGVAGEAMGFWRKFRRRFGKTAQIGAIGLELADMWPVIRERIEILQRDDPVVAKLYDALERLYRLLHR